MQDTDKVMRTLPYEPMQLSKPYADWQAASFASILNVLLCHHELLSAYHRGA